MEFKDGHSYYGNDAESNEPVDTEPLKWGFNLDDDIDPEEILNFFHCVCNVFGELNVLKAIEIKEEGKVFDRVKLRARVSKNGSTMFNGYMEARFTENPFANYSLRLEPFFKHHDSEFYQLDLSVEK